MNRIDMKDLLFEYNETDEKISDFKFSISKEIYKKRKELGMSQKGFAKHMGVSQGMVSKWESYYYNFTIESMVEILDKLGLEFNFSISEKKQSFFEVSEIDDTYNNFALESGLFDLSTSLEENEEAA